MIPPIVTAMFETACASVSDLRGRISQVRSIPYAPGMTHEAISFKLDSDRYQGVLKGRNYDLMLGHGKESDKAVAIRVLLDGDAVKL